MKKILPCGCHSVDVSGNVFSRIVQYSKTGHCGIITEVGKDWRLLHPVEGHSGYFQVCLHGRIIRVNRLIALNFIPNPFAYPESQHINGIRSDNRVLNLKWGNQKHNAFDRDRHGHTRRGTRCIQSKLSPEKAQEIRRLRQEGRTLLTLARQFSVSKKLILLVIQNKIWREAQ